MATAVAVLFIVIVALAGLGLAVVNALHQNAWGVFTIVYDHTHCLRYGPVLAETSPRSNWRDVFARCCTVNDLHYRGKIGRTIRVGRMVPVRPKYPRLGIGDLWVFGVRSSCMDVAGASRLSFYVHEAWSRCIVGDRRHCSSPSNRNAQYYRVYPWQRADNPRNIIPIFIYYHRLRGDLWISLPRVIRHDT